MGDLMIKQRTRSHWNPQLEPRRPWPPMFRTPFQRVPPFNFRPMEQPPWREPFQNGYGLPQTNKSRDYYFLAPYYRNVMPPPPKPQKERQPMMDIRRRTNRKMEEKPACHCKSRSMEDVRFDVVEVTPEWENDENGNHLGKPRKFGLGKPYGQHSMENLLLDTVYTPPSKRGSRFKVYIYICIIFFYKHCTVFYIYSSFHQGRDDLTIE